MAKTERIEVPTYSYVQLGKLKEGIWHIWVRCTPIGTKEPEPSGGKSTEELMLEDIDRHIRNLQNRRTP